MNYVRNKFRIKLLFEVIQKKSDTRFIYLRIIVDGIPKETSTKRKWHANRWDTTGERAIGSKEDARTLNHFLDTMEMKINNYKTDLMYTEKTISAQRIIDFVLGRVTSKAMLLEEFKKHNDEIYSLVGKDYALATYKRYETARFRVTEFVIEKYGVNDIEFRDLDFEFIRNYELHLKTVRNCVNNSVLKYVLCLKKVICRAMDKNILAQDPIRAFKMKRTKTTKNSLTAWEL